MPSKRGPPNNGGKRLIFRRYFVHPKTGKRIYPRSGKVFPMWVDD